ncbi:MAG: adenine phosphoribosyltransferase [bacterium]
MDDLAMYIRNINDFPKKGIVFRDITTLLKDASAFHRASQILVDQYKDNQVEKIVCIESRGFIFGAVLASALKAGFIPVRKPKKLPAATLREEYALEYGTDALEIHQDSISPGDRVLVHDDLLATGGTVSAACKLVEKLGGNIVGVSFLIELNFLKGRDKLSKYNTFSLITYSEE